MSKVRYKTNWMGPINREWIQKNGNYWSAGRIDFWNNLHPDDEHLDEMSVPIMHAEDWYRFSDWLRPIETDFPWTLEQLVELYEKENPKIRWFKYDDV
jgi:hypothetical protein